MALATPSWIQAVREGKGALRPPASKTESSSANKPKGDRRGGRGRKGGTQALRKGSGRRAQSPGERGLNAPREGAELGVGDVGMTPAPRSSSLVEMKCHPRPAEQPGGARPRLSAPGFLRLQERHSDGHGVFG